MTPWNKWLYALAVLTGLVVAVSSAALAIRTGSWSPVLAVGWLPAVVVAICPTPRRTPAK